MVIAVDAMGGDFAPDAVLDGALLAASQGASLCLFGDKELLERLLSQRNDKWRDLPIVVDHAPDIIAMDEEPVASIQKKTKSSLVQAVQSVKAGRCKAVISAGNSGALMASATLFLGREKGIKRPAIAGFVPSSKGPVLMLDLGANTECKPEYLAQFALMGSNYAKKYLGKSTPKVALLSNGHERGKGSQLTKEAFKLISQNNNLNFLGNIEPYGIFGGDADVVVSDGFSGNVLLKTMEATFSFFKRELIASCKGDKVLSEWGNSFFCAMSEKADVRVQGGASLLGVKGLVIVCHGNADAFAIKQAIMRVDGLIREKVEESEEVVAST